MLFNVSGLMMEGTGATRSHEVSGTLHTQERPPERLKGKIDLMRTPAGILVQAHIELIDPESCSRCLEPLEETLRFDFAEEFFAPPELRSGHTVDEDEIDAEAFMIDEQQMLDLTEAVRQYREASADMQPLCRPDCKGLCPNCGWNLNLGDCDCNKEPIDSRWATLAALRGNDVDGKE
jgi:uncharacterized protein